MIYLIIFISLLIACIVLGILTAILKRKKAKLEKKGEESPCSK